MQILLACAKIMNSKTELATPCVTTPVFEAEANRFALELCQWSVPALAKTLKCSEAIAAEAHLRYSRFHDNTEKLPAILAYYGQAYKYLRAAEFSPADFTFAQHHLHICSFLYGLLRPLDLIHSYRVEGNVSLQCIDDMQLFAFWRQRLTDMLVAAVKADDGVLVHLATEEMEHLFDWKRVCSEVCVVQPLFYTDQGHRLKAVAVHAKSCRGAMARQIIVEQQSSVDALLNFRLNGYVYAPGYGDRQHPHFIKTDD